MKPILLLLAVALLNAEDRAGTVTFSDGHSVSGTVRLAPGAKLQLHDGANLRDLDLARVAEIRLVPVSEKLVHKFRMIEAGKAIREEMGQPYPLRELTARIDLGDGSVASGRLYSTALVVDADDQRTKVLLLSKQQGEPGATLDALVYPQRVVFADNALAADDPRRLWLADGTADELGVLTRDGLAAMDVKRDGTGWTIDPLRGASPYVALRCGNEIHVGWPTGDAMLAAQITPWLVQLRDYFEERRLISVWRPPGNQGIHALVLLVRRGESTDGPRKAWHVEAWRLQFDDDGERLLFAGRGTLLRGLYGNDGELPTVTADAALWPQHRDGDTLVIGGGP